MNVKYINPFLKATQAVFKEFVGIEVKPGSPSIFDPKHDTINFDISGIIGLAGEAVGVIVISFPKIPILKMISHMSGEDIKIFDDIVVDGVGEIVNIVAGNAKKDLEEYKIVISLPSIVKGDNHQLSWMSGVPVISIPFSSEKGDFYLFISIKNLLA